MLVLQLRLRLHVTEYVYSFLFLHLLLLKLLMIHNMINMIIVLQQVIFSAGECRDDVKVMNTLHLTDDTVSLALACS